MKKSLMLPLLVALSGCGSDDEVQIAKPTPELPDPNKPLDNFDVFVDTKETFSGKIKVYLGRLRPCSEYPSYCEADGRTQMTPDDSQYILTIRADEMKRVLGASIRDDIYTDGNYSVLDVLNYLGKTRDDFKFELGEFDESIGTYKFNVSWDRNGDGEFTAADNIDGEANLSSPDWYARFTYTAGEFMRESGQPTLEVLYDRLDEFVVRDNMEIRFESFSLAMTERREEVQRIQVERLAQSGGFVVPKILVDFLDGAGRVPVAVNIDTKPYNIRQDMFQKDTISMMDVLLSADQQQLADIDYSYWPTLSTRANVGSYAVHGINGQRTQGFSGWTLQVGEMYTINDFFNPGPLRKQPGGAVQAIINAGDKYCGWMVPDGQHTRESARTCYEEWGNSFGGANIHHMTDVWVSRYPPEAISLVWQTKQWDIWNATEQNITQDGQFPQYDISKAVAPLDESHFGWKVADCAMCHSVDDIHLNGDSPSLPATAEPYFCASCHGSNGAAKGHGETSRCFWCHSQDKKMENHGDASMMVQIGQVACVDRATDEVDTSFTGPCATASNLPPVTDAPSPVPVLVPHDPAGNLQTQFPDIRYAPTLTSTGNSDWKTSQTFPDPYSCLTCHPNQ